VNTLLDRPLHHFNAYYQDNALLIQFIVAEFIETHQLIHDVIQMSLQVLEAPYQLSYCLMPLCQKVNELIGYCASRQSALASQWIKGPLTQLKSYSEQFSANTYHQNKHHVNLSLGINQLWLATLHFLELLNHLQTALKKVQEASSYFLLVKRAFQAFQGRANRIPRLILKALTSYIDNENVVYCLLRKKTQLTEIYGHLFMSKLFKGSLASKKLLKLLLNRYQARGYETHLHSFEHLLPLEESIL